MKMVTITNCNECPHYAVTGFGRMAVCMISSNGFISDGLQPYRHPRFRIPEWCPLPDMGTGEREDEK